MKVLEGGQDTVRKVTRWGSIWKYFQYPKISLSDGINFQVWINYVAGGAHEGQVVSKFEKSPQTRFVSKNYKWYLSENEISLIF